MKINSWRSAMNESSVKYLHQPILKRTRRSELDPEVLRVGPYRSMLSFLRSMECSTAE